MAAFYGSAFIHTHGKRLPDSHEYVTHESYATLVSRLESVAATHPTRYRLRVGALAVLGYACVAAMMLGLLAFLPLDLEERFHVADWTEDVYGADAALPLVTALVHDAPRHASGCFMLGRLLLARNEESGIAYLERAMQIDPGATGMAAAVIAGYLRNVGRVQEASAFQAEADAVIAEAEAADAERRRVGPGDHFVPADVQDSDRARLVEQLARSSAVGRAWLVRKVTRHAAKRPCYVLGIARAEPWWRFVSDGSNTYLVRKLVEELDLPGGTIVFVLTRKRRWLRRALRRVSGAEVYRRRNR
jgi:hypothetical protein